MGTCLVFIGNFSNVDKKTKHRYSELVSLLNRHSYYYHGLDKPKVSDAVYDGLMNELKQLEDEYPSEISSQSPTQRIGTKPTEKFEKYAHTQRMISLLDCFSDAEVLAWFTRIKKLNESVDNTHFWVDSKKDGLACALHYQDGLLVRAITRGDGTQGEVVTGNIKTIKSIPLSLPTEHPFSGGFTEVRGEIIMTKNDFKLLNKKRSAAGLDAFMNPRNLAAGTVRQLDPRLVTERPLRFHGYDVLRPDNQEVPTNDFAYRTLKELYFVVDEEAHLETSIEGVLEYAHKFEGKRDELEYITDGLVVKINNRELYESLGIVGKNPRGAIAYKYPAEEATTVLKDIVISIGRTGAATPVAVFDPVIVAGTTVQHASLHNADEIDRKDIRIGDTVVIFKAGDIIPQVASVVKELRPNDAKRFHYETELKRQYPELEFVRPEGEAVYRVKGVTGPVLLKRGLQHFASRGALDIEGLGEKNVIALVDAGLVQDFADIYTLTVEQLKGLERFADISARNLVEAIADKKHPPLSRFIFGLGVRHVGAQTAIDLANNYKKLDNLGTATYDELKAIDGVGEIVAESILAWFVDDDNQALLAKFRQLGVWPQEVKRVGGKLFGKSFVITGSLDSMSRDAAAEKIRSHGGTFQTSVAKGTTYLVMGNKAGQSKAVKAKKLGTEVINEQELLKLL